MPPSAPPAPPSPAEERLLHHLKTKGPQPAAGLARRLQITPTAVRQHLTRLLAEGWVAYEEVQGRRGRPRRLWRPTPQADVLFPDAHAELAVGMVEDVRKAFGGAGLARLLEERTRRQAAAYRARMPPPESPLAQRVAALAKIRSEEGYLAAVEPGEGGALHLVENHCPVCAVARTCTGLCDGELALFRDVLGPGLEIEREEHILAGARRCRYRIAAREGRTARRG